jgi:hypothetical protein
LINRNKSEDELVLIKRSLDETKKDLENADKTNNLTSVRLSKLEKVHEELNEKYKLQKKNNTTWFTTTGNPF